LEVGLCSLIFVVLPGKAAAQDADMQRDINAAIDRGVEFLKSTQNANGTWPRDAKDIGSTILAAWTLLESGVPPNDAVIQKAATAIRKEMVKERKNYNLSLSIFFFNKLGDSQDIPFIEAAATRLLRAQGVDGGWSYFCQATGAEEQLLATTLANRRNGNEPTPPVLPRTANQLSKEIKQALQQLSGQTPPQTGSDNSNTQFAMLALWVAGRYGLPIQTAMSKIERRFRMSERPDGSWHYVNIPTFVPIPERERSHAMTCAGLLGLALGYASDKNRANVKNLATDPAVQAGFYYVARIMRGQAGPYDRRHYYLLWSLERMAVAYNVKTIDKIEWYVWGARQLLKRQAASGGWTDGEFAAGNCDTCFALLFLKRVNVVGDLSKVINKGAITDKKKKDTGPIILDNPIVEEEPKKSKDNKRINPERRGSSRLSGKVDAAVRRIDPQIMPMTQIKSVQSV
jgi:hypothetical protein